jgi:hypothetical protein
MSTCKREGCQSQVQARGLCNTHYRQWSRDNPEHRQHLLILKTIEEVLPATRREIIDETGLCLPAVNRALDLLHEAGKAHIGDHEPPTVPGTRWQPVWVAGKGRHKAVSPEQRYAYRLGRNRQSYARRKLSSLFRVAA